MKIFKALGKAEMKNVTGGTGWQCLSNSDCPANDECDSQTNICGGNKIEACNGKQEGDYCVWSSKGTPYAGYCRSFIAGPLHCSDLI